MFCKVVCVSGAVGVHQFPSGQAARLCSSEGINLNWRYPSRFDEPYREESNRYSVEFEDLKVMEFNFFPIQLNRLNWRDFLNQRNPVAAALMSKLRLAMTEEEKKPSIRPQRCLMCKQIPVLGLKTSWHEGF